MANLLSLNRQFPIIPIRNGVVFPYTENVLVFGRPRSVAAVENAFAKDSLAVIVMQKNAKVNEPTPADLYQTATLVKIEKLLENEEQGRVEINALIKGVARVQILSYDAFEPFLLGRVVEIPDQVFEDEETKAFANHINNQLKRAVHLGKGMDFISFMKITGGLSPVELANQVAAILDIKPQQRQELLEETNLSQRLRKIVSYLSSELRILEIEKKIDVKTQAKFDKNFRKSVLEERLKTIEKELGKDGENRQVKEYVEKIKKAKMPKKVEEKAKHELKRLSQMSTYNPEASYLRAYLDWLTELPWSVKSTNHVEMKQAQKVLDQDHYGLAKVKERIIEYLAIMRLKSLKEASKKAAQTPLFQKTENRKQRTENREQKTEEETVKNNLGTDEQKTDEERKEGVQPTILCFVGPPGVGKTSIGRSIARSLGRKFVKMSLGGIRDEAEIRGHRRTYVGALPGRIIQGVRTAGTKNPIFMLDEIDKVGADFRGDPSAALLEALDPEQNFSFEDHYLEVPFDLSDVFFITTCNVLDTIPPALRDRLEIIHFPGYTEDEKFHIAKGHLIKKQLEAHVLSESQAVLTDSALYRMIQRYTREAGVRNLERQIAKAFRKVAKKVAEGRKRKIKIGLSDLGKYLGPPKFTSYLAEKEDTVGMATGLAWTEAGGDILFIEVALMPGKGNLLLTGQLGDIMKESCQAAMSYVRSRFKLLGLKEKFYQNLDIHVHVPEGAVPKDGPSAGISIASALVSALTKTPVRRDVGMTGEITLRGRALEIGGVKEKIIAAHRAGLKTIVIPAENKKDLEEIPKKVLRDLKFQFVKHMDEVLKTALVKMPKLNGELRKPQKKEKVSPQISHPSPLPQPLPAPLMVD